MVASKTGGNAAERPQLMSLALAASLWFAGCSEAPKPEAAPAVKLDGEAIIFPKDSVQLKSLVMETAEERASGAVRLNGRLSWNEDRTVRIFTPFAGRVGSIAVQVGDSVKQGQTLAVIASPDFGQAQAETRRAQGDFSFAQQNLARARDLHEHGVVAAKDLNAAEAEFARAESEIKRTEARLKMYGSGSEIDQTYALKSPLAGVVVEKNINPGQELRPDQSGGPALFVITNPSSLWLLLDAAEKDLANLAVGGVVKVQVPAYPKGEFSAKVVSISDFLDPQTRTVKVRAVIDNSARKLKGEMFVNAEVKSSHASVIKVSSRAVIFQGGKFFVFVDEGDGRFVRREVVTGDTDDGYVTIESGVAAGQKVVAEGALLLQQVLAPRRLVK